MTKSNAIAASAIGALATMGDIRGELYGTKHKGSKVPASIKKEKNRAKAKAAKKARRK